MKFNNLLKFNGGNLAILCRNCHCIIKVGYQFNSLERTASLKDKHLHKFAEFFLNLKLKLDPNYCLCKECKSNTLKE